MNKMLTKDNLGGLKVLHPRVIDTAGELTASQRKRQAEICEKLIEEGAQGSDLKWLSFYSECLISYDIDMSGARRASFEAGKYAPAFISPEYCEEMRKGMKKGGRK